MLFALLVLVRVIFTREEPEHFSIPVLARAEHGLFLDHSTALEAFFNENEVRPAVGGVAHILLDRLADRVPWTARVNGDLRNALASITVDGLLDHCNKFVDHDIQTLTGVGFEPNC